MLKQIEFAAHYVVNDYIEQQKYKVNYQFVHQLPVYKGFVALFKQYSKSFNVLKFNHRIEVLLTK